ncbi:MAG: hypothetical protein KBA51_04560 [Kiritimatiellae bacterium]|nr:hypothetical protein [Kiritimatiellia bacterium]
MHRNIWKRLTLAAVCLAWMALPDGHAQQGAANPVGRIRVSQKNTRAPDYSVQTNVRASKKKYEQWLSIEVAYETVIPWTDDLKITYYAYMQTGNPREPEVILRGEETFTNIPKGTHEDFAFIHPAILQRYGKVMGIAVEFTYGDRLVAAESVPGNFAYKTAVERLPKKEGAILPKSRSPFALVDVSGFEMTKEAAR